MLSAGDLLWVPFVYSLQPRYLVFNPVELSPLGVAAILAVTATGYYIFRSANGEKNNFRNGKNPKSEYRSYCSDDLLTLTGRPHLHGHRVRKQVAHQWMVGYPAPPELRVRYLARFAFELTKLKYSL